MNTLTFKKPMTVLAMTSSMLFFYPVAYAKDNPWSVVPYVGLSVLGDQSAGINDSDDMANGEFNLTTGSGFTAGISARYDYRNSPWISEFGWEYRSNDSSATTSDGESFESGNYASNTFYLNGRYAFFNESSYTPWIGGGAIWTQEIDIDIQSDATANSFSDSGSVGVQLLAGVDYNLSDRFYLTSEIRYSSQSGLDLTSENSAGHVSDINYQPLTFGLGLGIRF